MRRDASSGTLRHLTLRALSTLHGSPRGNPDVSACRREPQTHPVPVMEVDVLAFLEVAKPFGKITCPECSVLWDAAMEKL